MTKNARKSKHFELALKAVKDVDSRKETDIFSLEDGINRIAWGHAALASLLNGCCGSDDSVVWGVDKLRGDSRDLQAKFAGLVHKKARKKG